MESSSQPATVPGRPSRLVTWRAHVAVWATVGLLWGVGEALVIVVRGGRDPLTVLCFQPVLIALVGLPISLVVSFGEPSRAPARVGMLLSTLAVALPVAVWANLAFVRNTPMLSLTNLGVVAGALLVGLIGATLTAPLWRRLGDVLHSRGPDRMAGNVGGVLLLLCAWRVIWAFGVTAPGPWPQPDRAAGDPPNLVLIVLDTVRADHLSCYGYERETSPRLDALPGTRFELAYAQAHWTAPSTASLLTGLYPSTHRTTAIAARLPARAVTLTERLSAAGFVTGFATANIAVSTPFGFTRGADWIVSDLQLPQHRLYPSSLGHLFMSRGTDLSRAASLNRFAFRFLQSVRDQRFFLYMHYMDPHHPYDPPAPEADRFDPGFDGRRIVDPSIEDQWPISEPERRDMLARYDGEIRYLDGQVGALLDELQRLGLRDDTIVVVTADHGEEFLDHGGWIHGASVYEEMIHVPLIVSDPRLPSREQRASRQVVRLVDVVPTVLELLDEPPDPSLQGRSFAALLARPGASPPEAVPVLVEGTTSGHLALLSGGYKLIQRTGDDPGFELYDLVADPGEQEDLSATHPEVAQRLAEELDALLGPLRAAGLEPEHVALDPAQERALRQLGYVK